MPLGSLFRVGKAAKTASRITTAKSILGDKSTKPLRTGVAAGGIGATFAVIKDQSDKKKAKAKKKKKTVKRKKK